MPLIAPSLLASDFLNLSAESKMVNDSEADWFHLDVMDGRFVPNISFGIPVVKAFAQVAKKPLDVHLMIEEPEKYVTAFAHAGANHLSVHLEACPHLHRTIQMIHNEGLKAGVAINPHTTVEQLKDVINDIEIVCMMSVNPGFGGQKFIAHTLEKIKILREIIDKSDSQALIEIDGGVTQENAGEIIKAGADVLVAGSTVFKSEYPKSTISALKKLN